MREAGIGASLLLITMGALLAFVIDVQTTGLDLNAVGVILMIVGLLGLVFSIIAFRGMFGIGPRNVPDYHEDHIHEP